MTQPNLQLMDDDFLVERARSEADAFEAIYQRHSAPVYRMCLRACGNPDLADDLTATVFLKAFEKLDQYRPKRGSTFRSWLFTIAQNTVRDHWRRNNRLSMWDGDAPDVSDPEPEEIILARFELEEFRAVLDTLTERHRTIVEFRLSGLTTHEIANALGITISAVKSAQTRAYTNIRARLCHDGDQS